MSGTLYLCATPIGNLEDITLRVIRTLKEVDIIAAEDTRNSIKLLNYFEIKTPLTSYHEFNKYDKAKFLIQKMYEGKNIALITDAGTPGISDPGEELVRQAVEAKISITSLPGACACITALTTSALSTRRFAFEGFLPQEKKERRNILSDLEKESRTIILYEAPHRLIKTLTELLQVLKDRNMSICRELTKLHETIYRGLLSEAIQYYEQTAPKGEIVIVLEGKSFKKQKEEAEAIWETLSIQDHMQLYLGKGLEKKEAMKAVASDRGIPKREVYKQFTQ